MIRSQKALLRHAQEFFLTWMVGYYDWGSVDIAPPELTPPAERRERGIGKYREKERLMFGLWEILIYSSHEKPPMGELSLRIRDRFEQHPVIVGDLDPMTWAKIGKYIRNTESQRKAS